LGDGSLISQSTPEGNWVGDIQVMWLNLVRETFIMELDNDNIPPHFQGSGDLIAEFLKIPVSIVRKISVGSLGEFD
jgi:hypothetical protein